MKLYAVSEQLANVILNYLATRPYREVSEMITALQQVKEIPQPVVQPASIVPEKP